MNLMVDTAEKTTISFNTTKQKQKLARAVAVKLDMENVSELMNWLLDEAIKSHLSNAAKKEFAESEHRQPVTEEELPKADSQRPAKK